MPYLDSVTITESDKKQSQRGAQRIEVVVPLRHAVVRRQLAEFCLRTLQECFVFRGQIRTYSEAERAAVKRIQDALERERVFKKIQFPIRSSKDSGEVVMLQGMAQFVQKRRKGAIKLYSKGLTQPNDSFEISDNYQFTKLTKKIKQQVLSSFNYLITSNIQVNQEGKIRFVDKFMYQSELDISVSSSHSHVEKKRLNLQQ